MTHPVRFVPPADSTCQIMLVLTGMELCTANFSEFVLLFSDLLRPTPIVPHSLSTTRQRDIPPPG